MEPKLSKQSQLILEKLKEEVKLNLLTAEELETVKKWCTLYEGFGAIAGLMTKIGAIVIFAITLLSYFDPWKAKP